VLPKKSIGWILTLLLVAGLLNPVASVLAHPLLGVAPGDLIAAMNTLRVSNGLPALVEDPIIDAVAQATAETMAANQMSWHIGNVSGRLAAAGYGGGGTVFGTENFAVGYTFGIDEIMVAWSDASHMIPAVKAAYCNIGAGVAKANNGMTYYVLQAAYVAGRSCGSYTSKGGGKPGTGGAPGVSQIIIPVKIATPDADGKVFHEVKAGQSLWAIAVAYKITIRDLEIWNNLPKDASLQIGQKLFIPGSNTAGYATPTPIGMIIPSTPEADGRIVHTVAAYQTLITISQAYGTDVDTLLRLNGLRVDAPLQIGQKLIVHPSNITPSPTPRPLTPIELLTPASDGKYYHTVQSGESLSRIADLYRVKTSDLMSWNGLSEASILQPGQKLLLQLTPPATITPSPAPATQTPTATTAPDTATPSLIPTETAAPSPTAQSVAASMNITTVGYLLIGLAGGGLVLVLIFSRKRK